MVRFAHFQHGSPKFGVWKLTKHVLIYSVPVWCVYVVCARMCVCAVVFMNAPSLTIVSIYKYHFWWILQWLVQDLPNTKGAKHSVEKL